MMNLTSVITFIQFFFVIVIGLYFWNLLRSQQGTRVAVERESRKEIEKLKRLRAISLTVPLSERTRPSAFSEIIGQADGITS
jgi:Lon-like ATP-dependent protease